MPCTEDKLSPIKLHNRIYRPDKTGVIHIPTHEGEYLVRLVTEGLLRKDWYYQTTIHSHRFITVARAKLEQSLHILIKESDLI